MQWHNAECQKGFRPVKESWKGFKGPAYQVGCLEGWKFSHYRWNQMYLALIFCKRWKLYLALTSGWSFSLYKWNLLYLAVPSHYRWNLLYLALTFCFRWYLLYLALTSEWSDVSQLPSFVTTVPIGHERSNGGENRFMHWRYLRWERKINICTEGSNLIKSYLGS